MDRLFAIVAGAFGLLGVALGAFGAHALQERFPARDLEIYEVAVRYQMYHALVLLFVALLLGRWAGGLAVWAGWAFIAGIVIFSGSLYLLVFTGVRGLGAITPIGGVAFLAGWALLIAHLVRAA